jgi:ribosomal protein S18 acetylase RimI-like enzyme
LKRGIGSSLLSEIEGKGLPLLLDVKKDNKVAIDFYTNKGFVKVSEKKNMWVLEKSD